MSARYYDVPSATSGVIWVGGVVGGFDSPARNLYAELAITLRQQGVASLRLRLRRPHWIPSSVADVRAAIRFLRRQGVKNIALVGHSIGSSIVIQAAPPERRSIRAIVSLSSLNLGGAALESLSRGTACLFIHGERDIVLPAWFSVRLHLRAPEPKRLLLLRRAGHRLGEARSLVRREILSWLGTHLVASDRTKSPARAAA